MATLGNTETESAVLGTLLTDDIALERLSATLTSEHFLDELHGRIFSACLAVKETRGSASTASVAARLTDDSDLQARGGTTYLTSLTDAATSFEVAENNARVMFEHFLRRALVSVGSVLARDAMERCDLDARHLLERAESEISQFIEADPFNGRFQNVGDMVANGFKESGVVSPLLATGLRDLDAKLGGLKPGELVVVAGQSGMGADILASRIAFNVAEARRMEVLPIGEHRVAKGAGVAYLALGDSAECLINRILTWLSGVDSARLCMGQLSAAEVEIVDSARQKLRGLPLRIYDAPTLSMTVLRARLRHLARTDGVGLVVIDGLRQLCLGAATDCDVRHRGLGDIARKLKALAKELNVPMVIVSGVATEGELRINKRPMIGDLPDPDVLDFYADLIMLVHRQSYYLEAFEPIRLSTETDEEFSSRQDDWIARCQQMWNIAEVRIAKNRNGGLGVVRLYFDGYRSLFADLDDPLSGTSSGEKSR